MNARLAPTTADGDREPTTKQCPWTGPHWPHLWPRCDVREWWCDGVAAQGSEA